MARGVPRPAIRRPISIVILTLSFLLLPVLTPLGLLIAVVVDLMERARGSNGFRRSRAVLLVSTLIVVDFVAFLVTLSVFALSPRGASPRRDARFHWLMTAWTTAIIRVLAATVPFSIDRSGIAGVSLANTIVISRHRSLLDAVLPASIIGQAGLMARYTLKEDLRWEPNIDLVGHAIPHRFVTRAPENLDAELARIRELGSFIGPDSAGLIFPEGTFFTERRKEQVVTSLERRDPKHAESARRMRYLLPPRPGGTLALLEGAPDADVVIMGHVGFEPFGTLTEILQNLGGQNQVTMKAWRYPRSQIPADQSDQIDWLFERWLELDEWIAQEHGARAVR